MRMKTHIAALSTIYLALMMSLSYARQLVIHGGDIGAIIISVPSSTNEISVLLPRGNGQWPSPLSITNLECRLSVTADGAAHTLTFVGDSGRFDASIMSTLINETTGETNIVNPLATLDGVTTDIISAWKKIAISDPRFTIIESE